MVGQSEQFLLAAQLGVQRCEVANTIEKGKADHRLHR
jgi:hypothetical protein